MPFKLLLWEDQYHEKYKPISHNATASQIMKECLDSGTPNCMQISRYTSFKASKITPKKIRWNRPSTTVGAANGWAKRSNTNFPALRPKIPWTNRKIVGRPTKQNKSLLRPTPSKIRKEDSLEGRHYCPRTLFKKISLDWVCQESFTRSVPAK